MIFKIIGYSIILVFYGTYFMKMIQQTKRGINTYRIGKGSKNKRTLYFEICLKVITYLVAIIQVVSIQASNCVYVNHILIYSGLLVAIIGVVIFIISIITMNESPRC